LKNKGVVHILVIYHDIRMFSHISEGLGETFLLMWLNIGLSLKIITILSPFKFQTQNR